MRLAYLILHEFQASQGLYPDLVSKQVTSNQHPPPPPSETKCKHNNYCFSGHFGVCVCALGWPGTYSLAQATLEPMLIHLLWPPLCWNHRHQLLLPYIFSTTFICLFILGCAHSEDSLWELGFSFHHVSTWD